MVPEFIRFPDVELTVLEHLRPLLGVPVVTVIPETRPSSFVFLRRTGGPRVGLVTDAAMLTIECWADTDVNAGALARSVRAYIGGMPGRTPGVNRVQEFSGPASLPDPTTGQARWTWTVSIDVRGRTL